MITTRRSFVKALSLAVGALPVPGAVRRLVESVTPEEATLEDAEAILRGLIARCVSGPVGEGEMALIASFLRRVELSDERLRGWQEAWEAGRATPEEEAPLDLRFVTGVCKPSRRQPWFRGNFRLMEAEVMPQVVRTFKRALSATGA